LFGPVGKAQSGFGVVRRDVVNNLPLPLARAGGDDPGTGLAGTGVDLFSLSKVTVGDRALA
ncbi:MAG: hypothetical protein KA777_13075, partial [Rhodoferax sp.]|nr:hypothetical protein [Rhodoferax sp.]